MIRSWNVRECGKGVNIVSYINYVCLNPVLVKLIFLKDGYAWIHIGNNGKASSNKRLKRESGGMGILVEENLFSHSVFIYSTCRRMFNLQR